MNIALTNRCSRRCAFCYQGDVMDHAQAAGSGDMSLEALRKLLEFAEANGEPKVTLVGGEPTLHHEFDAVLELFDASPVIQQVLLFTNGLFAASTLETIVAHGRKLLVCVNVLSPTEENPKFLERLHENLTEFVRRNIHFDLSFVIHRPDFDYEFLVDYVDRYHVGGVRWARAFPVVPGAAFVARDDLIKVGPRIVAMLRALETRGTRSYVDCPLPYSLFDDASLGYISRQALSVINWGTCGLTLEINPDLTVKACPSQREEERVPLASFANMSEMEQYFFGRMSAYRGAHRLFDHCVDCHYYKQGRCQGGCLSYSREAFVDEVPKATVQTFRIGEIPSSWRVRPLPHVSVWSENGQRVLGSGVSSDVKPEPLSERTDAYWNVLASGPKFGEAVSRFSPEHTEPLRAFVRRLQRIGLIDLVAEN